jgi:hypothetical protein
LEGKCSKELEMELREKLKTLYKIAKARQEFRKQFEQFAVENDGADTNGEVSQVVVEELMHLTSVTLPFFKDALLAQA